MYSELSKKLGLELKDKELYQQCFTHKSYINEAERNSEQPKDNERLEFLGDAVLQLVVTDYLFKEFTKIDEGQLTAWRSALVEGKNLAEVAEELELGTHLRLGRGEEKSGGRSKQYLLANTMESLLGAIYLDYGYDAAKQVIENFILNRLPQLLNEGADKDAKSALQELSQERFGVTPHYECIDESGPDHAKVFTMAAFVGERRLGSGEGSNKQAAAQAAAAAALEMLTIENQIVEQHSDN